MLEPRCWWILLTLSLKNRRRELQVSKEYRWAVRESGGLSNAVKYGKECLGVGCTGADKSKSYCNLV